MKSLLRVLALTLIFSTAYISQGATAIAACSIGTCTVHCDSGDIYTYYEISPRECCLKTSKFPVCPFGGWAEWYPGCPGTDAILCN